jgi:hypothetical protein
VWAVTTGWPGHVDGDSAQRKDPVDCGAAEDSGVSHGPPKTASYTPMLRGTTQSANPQPTIVLPLPCGVVTRLLPNCYQSVTQL